MAPRSNATTVMPASVSSLARMPPVQPRPTITTSTSLSFVAMARSSAHVRDAERVDRERLVAKFLDVLAVHGNNAGKADHLPTGFVAVAAVDRVRVHAFDHGLIQRHPENAGGQAAFEPQLARG